MNQNTAAAGAIVPAPNTLPAAGDEAQDARDLARLSDTRGPIRLGFWVLIVGFGLFLAWAAWAPLDEGVSAPAHVSVESRRQTIQHMQGGVVRQLFAREGALVREGEVLVELDDAVTRANFESIRQNYLSQRALESRLLAEIGAAPAITFHPDLLGAKDPIAVQHVNVQQQLFAARRAAQAADLAALQETVNNGEQHMAGVRQMLAARRAQQALQAQHLTNVRTLADEGFAPRNQALTLEQQQAELRSAISDLETTLQRTQSASSEARLRLAQRRQEYLRESSSQLADVRSEVQANQEKLAAVGLELSRTQIKAPVAGQIIGLAANGPGSVVSPGQKLMDILPQGEATILEVKIPPHVIDRVAVGNEVEVRFSAFSHKPNLVVLGKLVSVSGDVVADPNAVGVTHYVGRAELTAQGLEALGSQAVQPGMTAEVLIKGGERSLLAYLLQPLTKRVAASMTEQ